MREKCREGLGVEDTINPVTLEILTLTSNKTNTDNEVEIK